MPARAPATPPTSIAAARPRRPRFWRGAAGALALAAWTVAGVVWAALALAPVALLERGPRGRRAVRRALPERTARPLPPEPLAAVDVEADPDADAVPAARAAGEVFPG